MMQPKRTKYRKAFKGRNAGLAQSGNYVAFGDYGLATLEPAWITARQIEAARRAMTRSVKRGGKIWIRVFPDKPATKKPAETRMGSGTPASSNITRPGLTTATQPSGEPLPEPMRVSAGFFVYDLSGKRLIQTLPPRLILRVIAIRAASIWRLVTQPRSSALIP